MRVLRKGGSAVVVGGAEELQGRGELVGKWAKGRGVVGVHCDGYLCGRGAGVLVPRGRVIEGEDKEGVQM